MRHDARSQFAPFGDRRLDRCVDRGGIEAVAIDKGEVAAPAAPHRPRHRVDEHAQSVAFGERRDARRGVAHRHEIVRSRAPPGASARPGHRAPVRPRQVARRGRSQRPRAADRRAPVRAPPGRRAGAPPAIRRSGRSRPRRPAVPGLSRAPSRPAAKKKSATGPAARTASRSAKAVAMRLFSASSAATRRRCWPSWSKRAPSAPMRTSPCGSSVPLVPRAWAGSGASKTAPTKPSHLSRDTPSPLRPLVWNTRLWPARRASRRRKSLRATQPKVAREARCSRRGARRCGCRRADP